MNTNLSTNDMQIEDYEDQAVKRSRMAKGLGIAGAAAVGGAAIAGGTVYAASNDGDSPVDEALTADDMVPGAEIGEDIAPVEEAPAEPEVHYVYVEKPEPEPEPEPEPVAETAPRVTWDESTDYFVGDDKVVSIEEGTIDGHNFMLVDADADGRADVLAYDVNNNGEYEADEVVKLTEQDNVRMGHETAHSTEHHYEAPANQNYFDEPAPEQHYAYNEPAPGEHHAYNEPEYGRGDSYYGQDEPAIHNNFEDEKTGEDYSGDFAENNPDYNPHADMDYSDQYLAEDYGYDHQDSYGTDGYDGYRADIDMEDENTVADQPDLADADSEDGYDSMMGGEDFLG